MGVLVGAFVGGVASLVLLQMQRLAKRSTSKHVVAAMAGFGLLGVVTSFLVLAAGAIFAWKMIPQQLALSVFSEIIAFVGFTVGHILWHEKAVALHAKKRRNRE